MRKDQIDTAFTAEELRGSTVEPTYSGALSFLRRRYSKNFESADFAVVGVPFDIATTNRSGTRFGPAAVRAASAIMAWERPYGLDFDPRDVLACVDYGDVHFDFGRPQDVAAEIQAEISEILAADVGLLSIGGDHYVTYPILKAIHAKYGQVCLIHFDAHSDTWEDEPGRIFDHGTMFREAANDGLVVPAESVQIGLRTHNPDTMGFNILDAPWVHEHGVEAVIAEVRRIAGDRPAYITFDIDCLDPSFAPGTGTPVSGGLTSAQALAILRGLHGINLVAGDIVEVAPAYDVGQITALAGAHIGYEIMSIYAATRR